MADFQLANPVFEALDSGDITPLDISSRPPHWFETTPGSARREQGWVFSVGRSSLNDVVLAAPSVSDSHADVQIVVDDEGTLRIKLAARVTTNPTTVGCAKVPPNKRTSLGEGKEFKLGEVLCCVRLNLPEDNPAAAAGPTTGTAPMEEPEGLVEMVGGTQLDAVADENEMGMGGGGGGGRRQ